MFLVCVNDHQQIGNITLKLIIHEIITVLNELWIITILVKMILAIIIRA